VAVLGALLGAAAWLAYQRFCLPQLAPPVPKDLDKLAPQLRAYVTEKVKWVRVAPRNAQRQATLGMVYAANALWLEAREAFAKAARLNPKEPLAGLYFAVATQELGRQEESLALLRQLTAQFPGFAPGHYRLGEALLRRGAAAEAAPCFERLMALAPAEWRGPAGLGEVKLRQGNFGEAAKWLEKAVQLDPAAKPAHHLLGQAYQRLGRAEDAQRELRLGLNAKHYPMPDDWSVTAPQHMKLLQDQVQMALEYAQAGRPDRAVGILETARPFHPNDLLLLNNLALAYNQAGQPHQALEVLQRVLQQDNRNAPALITLAATCLALGLTNEALAHANRAAELAPDDAQSHLAKANVLLAFDQDAEALAELAAAFRCAPQSAQLQMDMGEICLRNLESPREAIAHYERAAELDPTLVPAWVRLAELHLRQTNYALARQALETLGKLAPDQPAVTLLRQRLQAAAPNQRPGPH
jgi:tetratricopeptide (TPR) repeat protein